MEKENLRRAEFLSFHEHRDLSAHRRLRVIRREHAEHAGAPILPQPTDSEDDMECMVLSEAAKKWLKQHGLEGFLRIVEAPPHGDAENVVKDIDTEVITEEAIRAMTGLPEGGIYSIDNPSPELLTRYFGEYSLGSKAYRTQGGEDLLFREIARVLHEYGHVYPRPPAMPRNRAGLIIATYEGVQVDWPVMIADGLSATIVSIKDGKKMWTTVAQWLTLLAPPVEPMKQRKRGRPTESTPKTASKRQQLLATQAKERPNRKRLAEKEASVDTSGRPLKIKLRLSEQQAEQQPEKTQGQDPLAALINNKTLEEEQQEDEPTETLLRRR